MRSATEAIFARSCKVIPGGVNSPVRSFKGLGLTPLIVESGFGDTIRDVDGKEYIDYCCSWGPLILGHAHPTIVRAAQEQIAKGSSFGIATAIEETFASKLVSLIPSLEKIRFVSSGTEATMTALRLARGYTGRSKIVKFIGHYHGHSDSLLVQAGSGVSFLNPIATSKGVHSNLIADTICLPFNDFVALRTFFRSPVAKQVAAVIVEPIAGNMGVVPPLEGFLESLREETAKVGALLIFDEVITGFRVGLTGAQGLYSIDPDLTCLGKIIGGGFPAAAVGGKAPIMDALAPLGQVYQAGTLSGNSVAMRAGLETILQVANDPTFYERLEQKTLHLARPIEEALAYTKLTACLQRCGSMLTLFFGVSQVRSKEQLDEERFAHFFRHLFDRGIYIPPASQEAWFVSAAHTDVHLDYTARVIADYLTTEK
ncbi:MAG: glutamate-1-semialdehyde 2,1-aminomutase [Verrucomicrobiota bacterium]|nr:glutamate-1-semialdehyde 2,1-aminomutase [Verrucomicrobiota bacterium]